VGLVPIDAAFDIEHHIDAPDGLRGASGCLPATPGDGGNISQLEELPPRVRPKLR